MLKQIQTTLSAAIILLISAPAISAVDVTINNGCDKSIYYKIYSPGSIYNNTYGPYKKGAGGQYLLDDNSTYNISLKSDASVICKVTPAMLKNPDVACVNFSQDKSGKCNQCKFYPGAQGLEHCGLTPKKSR